MLADLTGNVLFHLGRLFYSDQFEVGRKPQYPDVKHATTMRRLDKLGIANLVAAAQKEMNVIREKDSGGSKI